MSVVVLTGSTGRLGCHLLSQLLLDKKVSKIYALNREPSGASSALVDRQAKHFSRWGLDVKQLDSDKLQLLVCDTSLAELGLSKTKYEEIQQSVTTIIHNAWRVDFNLGLTTFEPLVAGVRQLIDLVLGSPSPSDVHLLFISSIGVVLNYPCEPGSAVPEAPITNPAVAVGNGYGESKWIAEHLIETAAQVSPLRATILRSGQLSGDSRTGGWNTSEWVPAILKIGQAIGCLPSRDHSNTWLDVDIAASAVLDIASHPDVDKLKTLHLVSPRPTPWDAFIRPIAEELDLPVVPHDEWMSLLKSQALDQASRDGHIPAHSLLDFFQSATLYEVPLSTQKAVQYSPTLANVSPLSKEDALRYLRYWQSVGYISK